MKIVTRDRNPIPDATNYRLIRSVAFFNRFTLSHLAQIEASTDSTIKAMNKLAMVKIQSNQPVNLDSESLVIGFAKLVELAIMTEADVANYRRDAEPTEVYT